MQSCGRFPQKMAVNMAGTTDEQTVRGRPFAAGHSEVEDAVGGARPTSGEQVQVIKEVSRIQISQPGLAQPSPDLPGSPSELPGVS